MTSIADIERMDRCALAGLWQDLRGGSVPPHMSQSVLRQILAFDLQVRHQGDLGPADRSRLERIAAKRSLPPTSPTLKPGARLLRTWNGVTHVVEITADGCLWNGTRHRSLSAIARAITGTRWSGPRFFGLSESDPAAKVRRKATAPKTICPRARVA